MKFRKKKSRYLRKLKPSEPTHTLTHFPSYPTSITPEMFMQIAQQGEAFGEALKKGIEENQVPGPVLYLSIPVTGRVLTEIQTLRKAGLWGRTDAETAARLLEDRLRQEISK